MEKVFGKPIVTQEAMHGRIKELGQQISHDYQGKDLLVVGVLKGAYIFLSDLVRAIRLPIHIDFLIPKKSKNGEKNPTTVKVWSELTEKITHRHVLLVEDIVDSGKTVNALVGKLQQQSPASIKVCTLLSRSENREVAIDLDYVGFEIPATFVVGYGLDYKQKYRNLPYLAKLDPAIIQENS